MMPGMDDRWRLKIAELLINELNLALAHVYNYAEENNIPLPTDLHERLGKIRELLARGSAHPLMPDEVKSLLWHVAKKITPIIQGYGIHFH